MFKRSDNGMNYDFAAPSKRAKLDLQKDNDSNEKKHGIKRDPTLDDAWGDDFAEEDFEEMDLIASQACTQEDTKMISAIQPSVNYMQNLDAPSSSKYPYPTSTPLERTERRSFKKTNFRDEKAAGTRNKEYMNFENSISNKKCHNSAVLPQNDIIVPDHAWTEKVEKLKKENEKLLNDFITKEGETAFLRHQLQQVQIRVENEKLERARFMEEQANRHRSEINNMCKEKEKLKTQLDLQRLEVTNLIERCKLLENGNISLLEPHTVDPNASMKINKTVNRIPSVPTTTKTVHFTERCLQTEYNNKHDYYLKAPYTHYPFAKIPQLIFETSSSERSVVDIQITEKTGRRNLPILQEENTVRIFENPEMVKPMITTINGKRLSVQFFLPDLATLERKTSSELNSENCTPIINALVSTARELMLNNIVVLQTIFQAMKNDDIRDMDDLYFSDKYKITPSCATSTCDPKSWDEDERGVETRRVIGILACVAKESDYLDNYIAGKTILLTQVDDRYKIYSEHMIRYNSWPKRGCDFEMIEIILELSTLLGLVRRSHQFSGLITAVIEVLCNVQRRIGFCSKGLEYVFRIFREFVFSRPLPLCYVPLVELLMNFIKHSAFVKNICMNSKTAAIVNWKGALYFKPDACTLQILMAQMENISWDDVTLINIAYAAVQSVRMALQMNDITLKTDSSKSCSCFMKLVMFAIKMLCNCSKLNVKKLKQVRSKYRLLNSSIVIHEVIITVCNVYHTIVSFLASHINQNAWVNIEQKQLKVLREGLTCLSHLATRDPDIVIRLSDIEDSFHFFMYNISNFENLILRESEQEALNLIRSTFILDKFPQSDTPSTEKINGDQLSIMSNFQKKQIVVVPSNDVHSRNNKTINKTVATIEYLYTTK